MRTPTLHIKKGDLVEVISGKDRGHQGKVLACHPREGRVLVEGANIVTRHQRPRGRQPGGKMEKPSPIHVSNVMLVCPKCGQRTRVKWAEQGGQHVRVCGRTERTADAKRWVACGQVIDEV